jgi:predicted metal-binding membrane protein
MMIALLLPKVTPIAIRLSPVADLEALHESTFHHSLDCLAGYVSKSLVPDVHRGCFRSHSLWRKIFSSGDQFILSVS